MRLTFHGGECCGIKHIHGLGSGPNAPNVIEPALSKKSTPTHDIHGEVVSSDLMYFSREAPEEKRHERLARFVKFVEDKAPNNIIEVVLCQPPKSYYDWVDQMVWEPYLKKLGFEKVNSHKNSNSDNTIHVYHLLVGKKDKE